MRIELLRHGGCIGGEADNGHAALAFPDGGNGRPLLAGLRAHRRIPEWAILNPAGAGGPEKIPLSASGQMLRCKKSRRIAYARARVIVGIVNRERRIGRSEEHTSELQSLMR